MIYRSLTNKKQTSCQIVEIAVNRSSLTVENAPIVVRRSRNQVLGQDQRPRQRLHGMKNLASLRKAKPNLGWAVC